MSAPEDAEDLGSPTALDLALGQGHPDALAAARARMAMDPAALLAVADEVAFVQDLRLLRIEAGPHFAGKMAHVLREAERRLGPVRSPWRAWPWAAAAAAAMVAVLAAFDSAPTPAAADDRLARNFVLQRNESAAAPAPEVEAPARELAWQDDVEVMRRRLDREASPVLRAALDEGLASERDALRAWLDPRNSRMLARLDMELRASADYRRAELARRGGLPAADERVQQLADAVVDAVGRGEADVTEWAGAARALVAAGALPPPRRQALAQCVDALAAAVATARGEALVFALAGLADAANVLDAAAAPVRAAGDRLLADVLAIDEESWSRRLPSLLLASASPLVVGEAAHVLGRLPAFGCDPQRCRVARGLLVGALRDRRSRGDDSPAVVAALLYGGAELLAEAERERWERDLRRWKPMRLVGDLALCQQFAWALAPGRRGASRHQAELRELAVVPTPTTLQPMASLCLVLASAYAAHPVPAAASSPRAGS